MFLPLVILFYNKGYLSANRYLAGFLFFSALYLLENFYFFYGKSLFIIAFFTTTHAFFYLIGPCAFLYVRSILKDNSVLSKIDYLHVVLKVGTAYTKVVFDDIVYLEKDKHYFDIHLISGKNLIVRYTISEMIALLPVKHLVKINKSCIINVRHISKIESRFVYVADLKFLMAKGVQKELLLSI